MAVTLVATVGSASANSVADLAFALAYFESYKQEADWAAFLALDDDAQARLLIAATQRLEEEEDTFCGARTDEVQALSQPRTYPYYDNEAGYARTAYLNGTAIDPFYKHAVCELANAIAVLGSDPSGTNASAAFKELEVPGFRAVYTDGAIPRFNDGLPDIVIRKLARFRRSGSGLTLVRV